MMSMLNLSAWHRDETFESLVPIVSVLVRVVRETLGLAVLVGGKEENA